MRQLRIFRDDVLATSEGCPFRHDGYQLMRNQLLAAVLEQDLELDRVDFGVLSERLKQNSLQEKIGAQWIALCLEKLPGATR